MNTDVIQGKWHQLKGSVKAEKLIGLVQERYGYARQRAQQEVDSFFARQPM
jgi:uncharacterized protein YjbJ (UPF0337 family)